MAGQIFLLGLFVIIMLVMDNGFERVKKKVLFFGDSITRQGRSENGFISLIESRMDNEGFLKRYSILAQGVDGNKVIDLLERVDKDVVSETPQIVVIYIGINDVWHSWRSGGTFDGRAFEQHYGELIAKILPVTKKIFLCTPSVVGEDPSLEIQPNSELETCSQIVVKLASDFSLPLIDIRSAFVTYLFKNNTNKLNHGILTSDGVHLNNIGNKLLAEVVWQSINNMLLV